MEKALTSLPGAADLFSLCFSFFVSFFLFLRLLLSPFLTTILGSAAVNGAAPSTSTVVN